MASGSELSGFDLSIENQDEYLQDLSDEQLEQLLYETLLVKAILSNACVYARWLVTFPFILLPLYGSH